MQDAFQIAGINPDRNLKNAGAQNSNIPNFEPKDNVLEETIQENSFALKSAYLVNTEAIREIHVLIKLKRAANHRYSIQRIVQGTNVAFICKKNFNGCCS